MRCVLFFYIEIYLKILTIFTNIGENGEKIIEFIRTKKRVAPLEVCKYFDVNNRFNFLIIFTITITNTDSLS